MSGRWSRAAHAFEHIVLVEADADAVLAALKLPREALGDKLVTVATPAAVSKRPRQQAARHRVPARRRRRAVRAGARLGRQERCSARTGWPRSTTGRSRRRCPVASDAPPGYDPAHAWTMVAGGDILLDRGVKLAIDGHAAGTDFPFNGGTAEITGTCKNCSPLGWDTAVHEAHRRTPARSASLIKGADIAIANFENPAPERLALPLRRARSSRPTRPTSPRSRTRASTGSRWPTTTSAMPGDNGILQTMKNLDKHDIAHAGAGQELEGRAQGVAAQGRRRDGRHAGLRHDRADVLGDGRQPGQRADDG